MPIALAFFSLLAWAWSSAAEATLFRVDLGPLGKIEGVLEISPANEPKTILSKLALGSTNAYNLEFPNEGIYIVRVRSQGKVIWKENVFALLNKPADDMLFKTGWKLEDSIRTVIKVQNAKGQIRYGISIRDKIYLRLRSAPRLVRVFNEDLSGAMLPAQDLTVEPITEKQAREETPSGELDISIEPNAADDDQTSYEPEWKGLLAGKEDKSWRQQILDLAARKSLKPLNRPTRVFANMRILQESFAVKRGGSTYEGAKSLGFGTGFGAHINYKELLTFQIEVDTHGTKTEYERGGDEAPAEEQKRIHARIGPVVDLLNINHGFPKYSLELGPVLAYNQIPLEKDNQAKIDLGLNFRSQYRGSFHGEFAFRFLRSRSWESAFTWIGTLKVATLNPMFSVYSRHTEYESGTSSANFDEVGVRLGLNRDF